LEKLCNYRVTRRIRGVPLVGGGCLYTVTMFAENGLGVDWKPKYPGGETRLERCKLLTYTIEK